MERNLRLCFVRTLTALPKNVFFTALKLKYLNVEF